DTQLINVVAADTKNFPPSISVRASKISIQPGDVIDLYADATDRDGDAVTIAWNAAQGQIIGKGNHVRLKIPPNAQGKIAVTATASDSFGNTSKHSVTLTIASQNVPPSDPGTNNPPPPAENRAPTIQRLYADNNPVRAGDRVTITVEASD